MKLLWQRFLPALGAFVCVLSVGAVPATGQTQTTGRISGTVRDQSGALIVRAEVTIVSLETGEQREIDTGTSGTYFLPLLRPGRYRLSVRAAGFSPAVLDSVLVAITETTIVNVELEVAGINVDPVFVRFSPPLKNDGPQLGRVVDSRPLSELPLATRNFTQILALSPGASVTLPDNTALGRNSQNVLVNGARVTQNNFELNGVDANNIATNAAALLAVPAPETIQEFTVQTSLYDASFGRAGGGSVQAITRSGSNEFRGAAYEYFRDESLNANNPFLVSPLPHSIRPASSTPIRF
ncbi:MAG: carboxypeptidase regulatory-like domain-containing protein [Acidobacteriota bacterium]